MDTKTFATEPVIVILLNLKCSTRSKGMTRHWSVFGESDWFLYFARVITYFVLICQFIFYVSLPIFMSLKLCENSEIMYFSWTSFPSLENNVVFHIFRLLRLVLEQQLNSLLTVLGETLEMNQWFCLSKRNNQKSLRPNSPLYCSFNIWNCKEPHWVTWWTPHNTYTLQYNHLVHPKI